MAKPKKFDSYDNSSGFEDAQSQLNDNLENLVGVLDADLMNAIGDNRDDMVDAYGVLAEQYELLAGQVEDHEADVDRLTEAYHQAEKELGQVQTELQKANRAIEVLQARLALAGLSTSTTQRRQRRALGRNPLDC